MAHLPHRCHGNFPPRHTALLLPCKVQFTREGMSAEIGSNLATKADGKNLPKELCRSGFFEMEKESNQCCHGQTRASCPSSKEPPPRKDVAPLLKRIGIHPEARRILGNSSVPVVSLIRLNLQSVTSSSLQPVVCLERLLLKSQGKPQSNVSILKHPQQSGFSQIKGNCLEKSEPQFEAANLSDLSYPRSIQTSWTKPYCPEDSPSAEQEQDSGYHCECNPDQHYIFLDSGSDQDEKTDSEVFYLDPDPEQTLVIEVDPDPESDRYHAFELEDEPGIECVMDVVEIEESEDQSPDLCCPHIDVDSSIPPPELEEMESEDFCAVCLNGGDLLCCDRCPKVFHLACHVPSLISLPVGGWVCSLCRTDQDPGEIYSCENSPPIKAPYTLSNQDQRRCEKLTLLLYCHTLSAPFHERVSPLARNYYQIIKRPIDLSLIRRKLDKSNTLHYFTIKQFVDDVLLMFKNCATFNYPDSEVAQAGRNLELFFLSKLKEIFQDLKFLSASQDEMDRAYLEVIHGKKTENNRKKRYALSGKKYSL